MPRRKRDIGAAGAGKSPSVVREFAGREDLLSAFDEALQLVTLDSPRVLAFYGIGGIGKSRLIRRLRGDQPDPSQLPRGAVQARIDFKDASNRLPVKALERARAQLHRQGVEFPTFDIAFAVWWRLANPALALSQSELRLLDEGEIAGEVLSVLHDVPAVGLIAKIPRVVSKAGRAVQNWWTRRGMGELTKIATLADSSEVAEWLPTFFGRDLLAWRKERGDRCAVLFFDTHEALWDGRGSGESGAPPDDWLREWAAHLDGVLTVVAGRSKLRWVEVDPTWDRHLSQLRLGELSSDDCDQLLAAAGIRESETRALVTERSRGVPQYLDLALDTYHQIKHTEGRTPDAEDFDEKLQALLDRFLSYVPSTVRQALFVLSVPETFDADRFRHLMRASGGGVMPTSHGLKSVTTYSFVEQTEPGRFAIHSLVRDALAALDDPNDRREIHALLFDSANELLEEIDLRYITEQQRQALREGVDHGIEALEPRSFLAWYREVKQPFEDAAELRLLLPLAQRIRTFSELALGPDDPLTLVSIHDLARLFWARAEYQAAERLYREALDGRERALGPDDADTLATVSGLASVRSSLADFAAAEQLYRRSLEGLERTAGQDHPETLRAVNNLAGVLESQGRYSEAEDLYRRALEGRERVLGKDHQDTLVTLNNLAYMFEGRGEHAAAEPLFRRVLEGRRRALGCDHPATLVATNNLASLLNLRGEHSEAEPLFRQVMQQQESVLGPDYPDTLISVNNLAHALSQTGRYAEAEPLYRRAVKSLENVLGVDHPYTLKVALNLAQLLLKTERVSEALSLFMPMLEGQQRVLGGAHPETLKSMSLLATFVGPIDDRKGEELARLVLEVQEVTLGEDHPSTLATVNRLGLILFWQDELNAAEDLFRRALEGATDRLGADHPSTRLYAANLSELLDARMQNGEH